MSRALKSWGGSCTAAPRCRTGMAVQLPSQRVIFATEEEVSHV
jgi:hypothetical protein